MKKSIIALLLVFYLAGCSFAEVLPDATNLASDPVFPSDASQAVTVPAEISTLPAETQPEPDDEDFVRVKTYIPDIVVELRYATENNFTNQRIYEFSDLWLRYGTVRKLICVQAELTQYGYGLKIWDGFRPPSAQFRLWEVCPDPTYVSNPTNGFSSHSRGNTVDITLVKDDGTELVMPTGFDDFSELADRDYSDCGQEAADNALLLEEVMKKHGFKPYSGEWWHFTDTQSYPVAEDFEPVPAAAYYADCSEFISLRTKPDTSADVITRIPAGEQLVILAKAGAFALVDCQGLTGYVLLDYIQPLA